VSEPGFVVGGQYENAAGPYTVVALENGSVRLRYASGFEMTLPSQGLWAQWEAIVSERTGRTAQRVQAGQKAGATAGTAAPRDGARPSRPRTDRAAKPKKATGETGFYTGVGYLATGCEITASVAGRDYPAFAQRYKILTGRTLIAPHAGLEIHERPTHRIGADLSVRFPATAAVLSAFDLGAGAAPEPADEPGWYVVSRTELVERLLKLGFDLGPNNDPRPVREHIPDTHRASFDRGIALRRGGRA
jgi:hypothetical protein